MATTKEYHLVRTGSRVRFLRTTEDGQKIPVDIYDDFKPHLRYTFTDADGRSKTLRFLKASDEIDQSIQIKNGFPANLKFTQADRDELLFKNGVLRTSKNNVQLFLDSIPSNESFVGDRGDYPIFFKEYKPQIEKKKNNDFIVSQAEAILKVQKMDEAQMDIALFKIFGTAFDLPKGENKLLEKKEILFDAINENDAALTIINDSDNKADTIESLIGKAINNDIISFIQKGDAISMKVNGKWTDIKRITADLEEEQKQLLFRDMLETKDGQIILDSIKKELDLIGKEKPKKEKDIDKNKNE